MRLPVQPLESALAALWNKPVKDTNETPVWPCLTTT